MNRFMKKPLISINVAWTIFICGILISVIWCVLCVTFIDKCGCWDDSTSLWELSPVLLVISFASVSFLKLTRANTIGLIGILILIMCGLWFYGAATCGACIDYYRSHGYDTTRDAIQNAVKNYQDKKNGALPIINGTVTVNGSEYNIINICPLLEQNGGTLEKISYGFWNGNASVDDNCDGGCSGCSANYSYIWAIDSNGSVYSSCVGEYCRTYNNSGIDGYQGEWP